MKVSIVIELEDPADWEVSEAQAVQALQNGLAKAANMSVDELADIWRSARAPKRRLHHEHRRTRGASQ